jgi:ParB-like chromosome segregation protein Spo0J
MNDKIQKISLSQLIAHPDNPNIMSVDKFKKLVRNIQRTGLYEPIIVRPHPQNQGKFQIINGHHRVQVLAKLGKKETNCIVWNVDDQQTEILLTTLNRLSGVDDPAKKIELLRKLKERFDSAELAKLLPNTAKQIEQLTNLKLNAVRCPLPAAQFAVPLVFFVNAEQNKIIESAISSIENQASSIELTKSQRRAKALTRIAQNFLKTGGFADAQKH